MLSREKEQISAESLAFDHGEILKKHWLKIGKKAGESKGTALYDLCLNAVGKQLAVRMGDEAGGHKGIHISWVGAQLQI